MENEPLIDDTLKSELTGLYRDADRHYHGLSHIEALLALATHFRALLSDPEAVEAAIWFHDAIYDSRASDNEARSAALAVERLGGRIDGERLSRISGMIEATATHIVPDLGDDSANSDAALFLDMDLSVLGSPEAEFHRYEKAVRREFAWVDEPAWRAGRSAVLKKFLDRPRIFHSDAFRHLEARARANIARSIKALAG